MATPGIGVRAERKPPVPLTMPPPTDGPYVNAVPKNSHHYQPTLREFSPSHLSLPPNQQQSHASILANRALLTGPKAVPLWPSPALDVPSQSGPIDRSLSTSDIHGARPRRLISVESRRQVPM